jgi:hypothetical protein
MRKSALSGESSVQGSHDQNSSAGVVGPTKEDHEKAKSDKDLPRNRFDVSHIVVKKPTPVIALNASTVVGAGVPSAAPIRITRDAKYVHFQLLKYCLYVLKP